MTVTNVALVPSAAQIAAGERVIDATPEQVPASAARLAERARDGGWTVRVTYASVMQPPTPRRAEWLLMESIAVRVYGFGWAVWENGRFASAQCGGRVVGLRSFTAQLSEANESKSCT